MVWISGGNRNPNKMIRFGMASEIWPESRPFQKCRKNLFFGEGDYSTAGRDTQCCTYISFDLRLFHPSR